MPLDLFEGPVGPLDIRLTILSKPQLTSIGWEIEKFDFQAENPLVRQRMEFLKKTYGVLRLAPNTEEFEVGEEIVITWPDPRDDYPLVRGIMLQLSAGMSVML